ncbi:hypothetical protein BGZ65_009715, partial [Modicella reniformis]
MNPLERPASSASMSLPMPSDTLPTHHHQIRQQHEHEQDHYHDHLHQLDPPYDLEYHHYPRSSCELSNNRARSAMSMRQQEDDYALYNVDSSDHRSNRPQLFERYTDDNLMMYRSRESSSLHRDDSKSTRSAYTTHLSHPEYMGSRTQPRDEVSGTGLGGDEATLGTTGALGWFNASPVLDAIVNWIEGPGNRPAIKKHDKPNPILDIPFQFFALLTFPEPDPRAGNKMSLAMVRETAFVQQRRRTLLILTAYTFLVRYCSFDFFLVLLFASNCGLLFLMKNSGRMNVNMAKRAVNQRVGWAKQWAGGLAGGLTGGLTGGFFKKVNIQESGAQQQQNGTGLNVSPTKSSPGTSVMQAESIRGGVAPSIAGEKLENTQEESTQVKRRGLFGKKKSTNTITTTSAAVGSSSTTVTQNGSGPSTTVTQNGSGPSTTVTQNGSGPSTLPLLDSGHGGDEASVMAGRTQKRGFFKRSTSRSATAPPGTIANVANHILARSITVSTSITAGLSSQANLKTQQNAVVAATNVSQTQSSPQLQLVPPRSPSPSATRKE